MSQETITFGCPTCGVQLRVPLSMAGVEGPCPKCRNPIRAPRPEPVAAHAGDRQDTNREEEGGLRQDSPAPDRSSPSTLPNREGEVPAPSAQAPRSVTAPLPPRPAEESEHSQTSRTPSRPPLPDLTTSESAPPSRSQEPSVPPSHAPLPTATASAPQAPSAAPAPPPSEEPRETVPQPAQERPVQRPSADPFPDLYPGAERPPEASSPSQSPPYQAENLRPAPAPQPAANPFSAAPGGAPTPTEAPAPSFPPQQEPSPKPAAESPQPNPFTAPAPQAVVPQTESESPVFSRPETSQAHSPAAPPAPNYPPHENSFPAPAPSPPEPYGSPSFGSFEHGDLPPTHAPQNPPESSGPPPQFPPPPGFPSNPPHSPEREDVAQPPESFSHPTYHPQQSGPSPLPNLSVAPQGAAFGQSQGPGQGQAQQPPAGAPSAYGTMPSDPHSPNPVPQNVLPLNPNDPVAANIKPLHTPESQPSESADSQSEGRRRLRWPGIVFPLLFLILAAIMVYLVLDLSELLPHSKNYRRIQTQERQEPAPSSPNMEARVRASEPPARIAPAGHVTEPAPRPAVREPSVPDVEPPRGPVIEERDRNATGEVGLPPMIDLDDPKPATDARTALSPSQVLRKFLEAQTLAERRPYMTESTRGERALAQGPLGGPLPKALNQRSLHYMNNTSEQHTEHFFEVSFVRSPDVTPIPILVQLNEWGDGKIKLHTDAFLDLYNDEMATFGEEPVPGERTFHVVADAYKHCFDERIPDARNKSFVKLRAHPRITPRLKAYFSKSSPLSQKIAQPEGLPWGTSGICTVTVKWNTTTPSQPFVELVRIDGFTWNP